MILLYNSFFILFHVNYFLTYVIVKSLDELEHEVLLNWSFVTIYFLFKLLLLSFWQSVMVKILLHLQNLLSVYFFIFNCEHAHENLEDSQKALHEDLVGLLVQKLDHFFFVELIHHLKCFVFQAVYDFISPLLLWIFVFTNFCSIGILVVFCVNVLFFLNHSTNMIRQLFFINQIGVQEIFMPHIVN